ncbi:hypothetical protein PGT21_032862 [Puccinia graminis f. sp. tritici]|uniref:Uncharacterized protein n=1 Tax=Puccinia graminis f. sp. tritici TaxID=56615 RepID=A0A5B0QPF7_PUCGR|nr:hypothetical protein PGT21_032862 [Puccinia graminis f. sp. tritici]
MAVVPSSLKLYNRLRQSAKGPNHGNMTWTTTHRHSASSSIAPAVDFRLKSALDFRLTELDPSRGADLMSSGHDGAEDWATLRSIFWSCPHMTELFIRVL